MHELQSTQSNEVFIGSDMPQPLAPSTSAASFSMGASWECAHGAEAVCSLHQLNALQHTDSYRTVQRASTNGTANQDPPKSMSYEHEQIADMLIYHGIE